MLHAKFQDYENFVLEKNIFQGLFGIYGRGSHLGHVTWAIDTIFSPFQRNLYI